MASISPERKSLFMLSGMSFSFAIGFGAIWFLLPSIVKNNVDNMIIFGIIYSIPNIVSFFLDIPTGAFIDYHGRKKPFLIAFVIMALLGFMLPSLTTLPRLIGFMLVFGIVNQFAILPGRAYLMDIAPKGKTSEYFGIFSAVFNLGYSIGPIIGGYFIAESLNVGLFSTGLFVAVLCIIAIIFLSLLKETMVETKSVSNSVRDVIIRDKILVRSILQYKQLKVVGVLILALTLVLIIIDGIIWSLEPLYNTLGIDSVLVGLILASFTVPYIIFEAPAGMIADRIGKHYTMLFGILLASICLISFGYTTNPWILLISAFIATVGLAFVRPSMDGLLTDLSAGKQKGMIVGVWDVAEDIGYVIGPILGGIISEVFQSIQIPFVLMGIAMLFFLPVIYLTKKYNTSV
jgi:MFS family permease